MTCSKSKKLLVEYADGRTADKELEEHLKSCQPCSAEVEALRASLSLAMATLTEPVPAPSAAFTPKLKQRFELSNGVKRIFFNIPKWTVASAAIILLTMGTVIALRLTQENAPPTSSQKVGRVSEPIQKEQNSALASAREKPLRDTTEMQMLMEMRPISQPYIDAWRATQSAEHAQEKIISTLKQADYKLLQRVLELLESSAAALEEIDEEEDASCYEEIT